MTWSWHHNNHNIIIRRSYHNHSHGHFHPHSHSQSRFSLFTHYHPHSRSTIVLVLTIVLILGAHSHPFSLLFSFSLNRYRYITWYQLSFHYDIQYHFRFCFPPIPNYRGVHISFLITLVFIVILIPASFSLPFSVSCSVLLPTYYHVRYVSVSL